MSISQVQTATTTAPTLTQGTATFASATTSGNLIELTITNNQGTANISGGPNFSISDSFPQPVTWALCSGSSQITAGGQCMEKYWGIATGGTGTITATALGTSEVPLICASEFSGVSSSGPVSSATGTNVFVDAVTSNPVTVTAGDLVTGGYTDSFGLTGSFGAFSSGTTQDGIYCTYDSGIISAWQQGVGGSTTYTGQGSGGYAIAVITHYSAAATVSVVLPTDVLFFGMI